ncbi:MAG: FeoB-associated Cys-rich membrane protein [Lachnospiraceae bacterium]|nr:FeoB-associated Cys-rich membrane protein [Lachnospiraceae bacterium]
MLDWLSHNIGNILVLIVLLCIIAGAVFVMIRDKRKGKSSCGGNCAGCAMNGKCNKS